jgi:hypothetical protein
MTDHKLLPPDTRVWIYQSSREFSAEEVSLIRKLSEEFIRQWTSHGQLMKASVEVFYSRFIVVFADETAASASGCSIDRSVQFIKDLQEEFSVSLLDRTLIAWRSGGKILTAPLPAFERMIAEQKVDGDTVVFNNLVSTKAGFELQWEIPLSQSWLVRKK